MKQLFYFLFYFCVDPAWERLSQDVTWTRYQSLAPSSKRNILIQLKTYLFFCAYFLIQPFPVQDEVISNFIQYLSENFSSPGAVKNYVYGLQSFCQLKSLTFPDLSLPRFKHHFKGISRVMAHIPSRAEPMSPLILMEVLKLLNLENPYHASMWAIMVLGFQLFARLSNLLPSTQQGFDPNYKLTRQDVSIASDSILVSIKWSKTNQNRDRVHQVPLHIIPNSPFCPLQTVLRLVRLTKCLPTDHLFSYTSQSQIKIITQSEFISFLRTNLKRAGFKDKIFSGHSLRRGGATLAFSSGVSSDLIKSHGDWKSDSYFIYLQFSLQDRLRVSKSMFKNQ